MEKRLRENSNLDKRETQPVIGQSASNNFYGWIERPDRVHHIDLLILNFFFVQLSFGKQSRNMLKIGVSLNLTKPPENLRNHHSDGKLL